MPSARPYRGRLLLWQFLVGEYQQQLSHVWTGHRRAWLHRQTWTRQCEHAMQNLKLECEQYNHDCIIRQSKNFQQHPVEILQEDWHRRKKTADSRPQTWNLSKDSESAVLEAKKHDKNRHFTPYWLICQKSAKMHVPINSTCFFTLYCMGFSVTQKKGCTVSAIIYTLNAYITRNYADSVDITP